MLRLFRADKRSFLPGDIITTAGHFKSKHPFGPSTEDLLDRLRPGDKPKRTDCLMLFEDEECARDHWCKFTNGRLYVVEIRLASALHRGDMNLVDQIARELEGGRAADHLADSYWSSAMTDGHCVEVLVAEGVVTAELGNEKERLLHFQRKYGVPTYEPESIEDLFEGREWNKT